MAKLRCAEKNGRIPFSFNGNWTTNIHLLFIASYYRQVSVDIENRNFSQVYIRLAATPLEIKRDTMGGGGGKKCFYKEKFA